MHPCQHNSRRGGRHQARAAARSRSRSRSIDIAPLPQHTQSHDSELGTEILLDWAWGAISSEKACRLARKSLKDQHRQSFQPHILLSQLTAYPIVDILDASVPILVFKCWHSHVGARALVFKCWYWEYGVQMLVLKIGKQMLLPKCGHSDVGVLVVNCWYSHVGAQMLVFKCWCSDIGTQMLDP